MADESFLTGAPSPHDRRGPRSAPLLAALAIAALLGFALFMALGTWQVQRRSWKLDLIERVEQRVHAPPSDPPTLAQWPTVSAARDEYRHVRLTGTFLHDRETLVQASTVLGPGFWVLTPLRTAHDGTVLINRGFVPPERRERLSRSGNEPEGDVTVTGLLRLTEPGGGFLRRNDPAHGRWYSRDVAAIATAHGLGRTAPYFVDQDAPSPEPPDEVWPAGGLTVVVFRNNHLVYAITWYGLALLVAWAAWQVIRTERRLRRHHDRRAGTPP